MNIYTNKRKYKIALLGIAILISIASLTYTNHMVNKLSKEERKKIELYALATRKIAQTKNLDEDLTIAWKIITQNTTIPVILTTEKDSIISSVNIEKGISSNKAKLKNYLIYIKEKNEPIVTNILNGKIIRNIYYDDSTILKQLYWYPFIQLLIFTIFALIAYWAFDSSRRAEQNKVWVGMSKETAHQLGTPISSLMAWLELLKLEETKEEYTTEIEKDINRLKTIIDRFSKIGAQPILTKTPVNPPLEEITNYMKKRLPNSIKLTYNYIPTNNTNTLLNKSLFSWVLENLIKNAIDSIEKDGKINITTNTNKNNVIIDIEDTGKGIPKNKSKQIFKPGITTKKRGWGLGLSLAKRIIEDYHKGQIFVKNSELNKGTTIRIILKKQL